VASPKWCKRLGTQARRSRGMATGSIARPGAVVPWLAWQACRIAAASLKGGAAGEAHSPMAAERGDTVASWCWSEEAGSVAYNGKVTLRSWAGDRWGTSYPPLFDNAKDLGSGSYPNPSR
jgi:hypothetical protein